MYPAFSAFPIYCLSIQLDLEISCQRQILLIYKSFFQTNINFFLRVSVFKTTTENNKNATYCQKCIRNNFISLL